MKMHTYVSTQELSCGYYLDSRGSQNLFGNSRLTVQTVKQLNRMMDGLPFSC